MSIKSRMVEFCESKNLVIWGCGFNASYLIEALPDIVDNIAECVDTDPSKEGRIFLNNWTIKDPSIIVKGEHKIIVTPDNAQGAVDYLIANGYVAYHDYILFNATSFKLEDVLCTVNQYSQRTLFVLYAGVSQISEPSRVEWSLRYLNSIVSNRYTWLRSNPPHIAEAHCDLPQYSDTYIKNIFSGLNAVVRDGVLQQSEHRSEYVNVIEGFRVTTDQPNHADYKVHMFGPSFVYGFGVEDKYTIPSYVQRRMNELSPNHYSVVNHGVRGIPLEAYPAKISVANIKQEDIVLIFIKRHHAYIEYLSNNGVMFIDLLNTIQRPHSHGEIFVDHIHMNYRGNSAVSNRVMDTIITFMEDKSPPPAINC